jgi:hypothetical protein
MGNQVDGAHSTNVGENNALRIWVVEPGDKRKIGRASSRLLGNTEIDLRELGCMY